MWEQLREGVLAIEEDCEWLLEKEGGHLHGLGMKGVGHKIGKEGQGGGGGQENVNGDEVGVGAHVRATVGRDERDIEVGEDDGQ